MLDQILRSRLLQVFESLNRMNATWLIAGTNTVRIWSSELLVGRFSPHKWETLNFIFFNLPVLIVFLNGKSRHAVG